MPSIVPLTSQDSVFLERIHKECFPDGWKQATFDFLLGENSSCGWMAKTGQDVPAGFILARVVVQEAEILTLAVRPACRRQKIGQSLVQELVRFLKSASCHRVFLEVAVNNAAALNLYSAQGFTGIGRRQDYYQGKNRTFIDGIIMACNIKDNIIA